jgi:hypothetical protein
MKKPDWLDHVNTYNLKLKLAFAIISISGVHALKTYLGGDLSLENVQIVAVVAGIRRTRINALPAVRIDADTERVLASLRPDDTVIDVARRLRLTPATVARMIQRGIEAGSDVQRWNLVPNDVFSVVMAYLRDHRYAKLRHVVERIREEHGSDADLPTLRVAMAFARRELYGGLSS